MSVPRRVILDLRKAMKGPITLRRLPPLLGVLLLLPAMSCQPRPKISHVNFTTQIKPLLEAQCVNCHQSGSLMGNLNLENHALATRPHPHGEVIKPGDPAHSLLFSVLVLKESAPQAMPPGGHRIEKEKVDLIERWIEQGARWPTGPDGVIQPKVDPGVRQGTKA